MALATILGLLLGIGGAVAKERLNSGFTNPRQVEEILQLPLLASISHMEKRDLTLNGKLIQMPFYSALKPLSRFSETMRSLRSGIQMTDVDNPPKVMQLTSTLPDEGKTTIALSIAVSAAGSGMKVLFIDADLRHPSGTRFFGLQKEAGLVDLLLGQADTQDVIRYRQDLKFWVLPAGSQTQNPTDLLGSDRMKTLVAGFKERIRFCCDRHTAHWTRYRPSCCLTTFGQGRICRSVGLNSARNRAAFHSATFRTQESRWHRV